jgi:endonuclease/exonuclease/phosphatase family metal-dependent hydrolase
MERTGLGVPGPQALATYPAWQPEKSIDHILVSHDIHVSRYEAPSLKLSDHLPVAVDIQLPEGIRVGRA